jgi:hypothetical protein
MLWKLHILHSHYNFLHGNMGAASDEHGQRLLQDISQIEKRYSGKCSPKMLADYCWSLL